MSATIEAANSIMWVANLRGLPFAEHARTAALAGFGGLSITPLGWHQLVAEGISSSDIRALCADEGISRIHLDPVANWTTAWRPENLDGFPLAFFAFPSEDFLRIAESVGAASLTAIAAFPSGAVSVGQMTEDFARLCDRAADLGMHCSLEFIPLDWGVPDLETAWTIVRDAGRANSGLVIDTWCFERSGSSLELLESIPGDRIDFVQLADGVVRVPANRTWVEDNLQHRLPPGMGVFPLSDLLGTLARTGGLSSVGPELFSWQFDTMSPEDIASVCRASLAAAADAAGIVHDLGAPGSGWEELFASPPAASDARKDVPARSHI
ncbi:sugar phosphate isomerase/epimerase family protein [uncultured Microbacterium sp.]|uniref:sugar phosphate isomerase/epimerase family protein n=1 Tax=uncultured Microbacterium sp. TaxID=191216 RepID=UPI0035CBB862